MNIYNTKQLTAKMCSMSLIRGPIVLLFFPYALYFEKHTHLFRRYSQGNAYDLTCKIICE